MLLQQLMDTGLWLKKKCFFAAMCVKYLGHRIDQDGLHPTYEKVWVIKGALSPTNITELRSFLCLINYYGKFLPQLYTFLKRVQTG